MASGTTMAVLSAMRMVSTRGGAHLYRIEICARQPFGLLALTEASVLAFLLSFSSVCWSLCKTDRKERKEDRNAHPCLSARSTERRRPTKRNAQRSWQETPKRDGEKGRTGLFARDTEKEDWQEERTTRSERDTGKKRTDKGNAALSPKETPKKDKRTERTPSLQKTPKREERYGRRQRKQRDITEAVRRSAAQLPCWLPCWSQPVVNCSVRHGSHIACGSSGTYLPASHLGRCGSRPSGQPTLDLGTLGY